MVDHKLVPIPLVFVFIVTIQTSNPDEDTVKKKKVELTKPCLSLWLTKFLIVVC